MARWEELAAEAPKLAAGIRSRFESHLHHVLGSLRRDGSPRLSGTEARFHAGDLWLGCMPGSRKADDLRRDPRFALHSAPLDEEMKDGDAKLSGRVEDVTDQATISAFLAAIGHPPAPDGGDPEAVLFRLDITQATLTTVAGDHLDIVTWTEGRGVETVERY